MLAGAGAYLAHALRRRARERDTSREWALVAQARYGAALDVVRNWRPPQVGANVDAWGYVRSLQVDAQMALGTRGELARQAVFDAPLSIHRAARRVDQSVLFLRLAAAQVSVDRGSIPRPVTDLAPFARIHAEAQALAGKLRAALDAIRAAADD